ncbi:MAG TPA: UDP-N-acetylglucosamine 1-carboxyvinyltransferase [Patescibacteria group bacterium]|nr:UDP-N-acetylglucosamine 1-carboxyvinyltransferase [Patescibacteria group bacterium]
MRKYIVKGGNKLSGEISVSGAKNVVLKAIIAACLTNETVEIKNVPLINDFFIMLELVKEIGGKVYLSGHTVKIEVKNINNIKIPLDMGAKIRTSSMFMAPLLVRKGEALIPNPGGCRIGARPIDRHIEGLKLMGAEVVYNSRDGYFHFKTAGLHGATYRFTKNTHTGTESLIMAAVLAKGRTVLENAAEEPEIDDLINFLNLMGADIKRTDKRTIVINGVKKLKGASYSIMADRNEVMTFAVLSALTGGNIRVKNFEMKDIEGFLTEFKKAGGKWEEKNGKVRFYVDGKILPTDIITAPHPGFMTDWQGPWAIFMTQADGTSTIHEAVYETRFGYVSELKKMGADLEFYKPKVQNPKEFYNFNYTAKDKENKQGLRIIGKTPLHNAVLNISDLRAGATLAIASLIAKGESVIYGVEYLERGYEAFDKRLISLGASIEAVDEEEQI